MHKRGWSVAGKSDEHLLRARYQARTVGSGDGLAAVSTIPGARSMWRMVNHFVLLSVFFPLYASSPKSSYAAVPAAAILKNFSCLPSTFTGLGKSSCTIEFTGTVAAPQTVYLTSTAPVTVPVPKSIVVPKAAAKASFTIKIGASHVARVATLTATANRTTKTATVRLNAYVAKIEPNPSKLTFGAVIVGKSLAKVIVISSIGTAPLKITAIASSRAVFKVSPVPLPLTLAPGKKRELTVTFAPKAAVALTAFVRLTSNASTTPLTIDVKGTGTPSVLSGLSCDRSALRAGAQTDACAVTLTGPATGNLSIHLASNNPAVRVPSSVNVSNGSSFASFIASATWVSTAQTATITASQDRITASFKIQLTQASASLSAQGVAFGNVSVDSTDTQSVSLLSSGTGPITISAIATSGTGFTVSGVTPPLTLDPGDAINALVAFSPMSGGAATGSITVNTNASNGRPLSLALTGTGVLYQVDLSWNAPGTNDPIAGYNVYRSEEGSPSYIIVNDDLVTGTIFVDQTVVNGTFYTYFVEAVDESGASSGPSGAFAIQIP